MGIDYDLSTFWVRRQRSKIGRGAVRCEGLRQAGDAIPATARVNSSCCIWASDSN